MTEANTQATQNQDPQQAPAAQTQATQTQGQQAPVIDYTKIQQMLEGTLAAKEDTALKAHFKQQGLSREEADQAIAAFKQQKAASQPDVNALQTQAAQAQAMAQQAMLEKEATLTAISLGLDAKTIPYVLKMADLSQVMGQDGKINDESLKNAINKVLSDEWEVANGENTPILGGTATFGFDDAVKCMKRGLKVKRQGWNGKNQYIELATGISYKNADGEIVNCMHAAIGNKAIAFVGTSGVQMGWLASQADMLAEDWMFVDR